ncbi:MAG: hypothetical protein ACRDWH_03460, partial [Acidimicrobiia bacterium]
GALVVLVVAAVVVWRYWVKALRLSSDPVERTSAPRKVTLLLLRIGFFFTGAGALIAVLFFLLRAALDGDATGLGEELSWSVPLVLVSAAMVWHLWEQRVKEPEEMAGPLAPVPGSVRPRMVTVVAFDPGPLPSMIQGMRFLRRSDGIGTVDQARAEEIVSVLDGVASTSALVTVGEGGFEVVPIQ